MATGSRLYPRPHHDFTPVGGLILASGTPDQAQMSQACHNSSSIWVC
jgi:hypothetical protein